MRPDLDVAKKTHTRVLGRPIKLVCAVLLTKVYVIGYPLFSRGATYLHFRMVWGNAISNKAMWCP